LGRQFGELTVYIDGASSGNPGPAGAGVVFLDPAQKEIEALSVYLGETTNNVAEYQALILALERAKKMGVGRLTVLSDSELLVKQFNGSYRVKNAGLKPLFEKAKALQENFASLEVRHVAREKNQQADQLARQGARRAGAFEKRSPGVKGSNQPACVDKLVAGALYLQEVSLLPEWSKVLPKDAETEAAAIGDINLGIPLLSSPVASGEPVSFADTLATRGGMAILRPGRSSQAQITAVEKIKSKKLTPGKEKKQDPGSLCACRDQQGRICVGGLVHPDRDLLKHVNALVKGGADLLVLEASLGHGSELLDGIGLIKKKHPQVPLIAGDVTDQAGARKALEAGADGIKVGAPFILGLRVPLFTAIQDCAVAAEDLGGLLIADVGTSELMVASSLIARAIGAGAHVVMAVLQPAGKGWQPQILAEGLDNLVDDLRMIMSCCGAKNIDELRRRSRFVRIYSGGQV
jgi:ribonuclease HI/IMP dehydrogenase/GMP reductase